MTERQKEAQALREQGLSYLRIGERLGIDSGTVWRLCNPERQRETRRAWMASGSESAERERRSRRRYQVEATKRRHAAHVKEARGLVLAAKQSGCGDCGANPADRRRLHLHHRDPVSKSFTVGEEVARCKSGAQLERIRAEIAKCEALCASCHRKRHTKGSSHALPGMLDFAEPENGPARLSPPRPGHQEAESR